VVSRCMSRQQHHLDKNIATSLRIGLMPSRPTKPRTNSIVSRVLFVQGAFKCLLAMGSRNSTSFSFENGLKRRRTGLRSIRALSRRRRRLRDISCNPISSDTFLHPALQPDLIHMACPAIPSVRFSAGRRFKQVLLYQLRAGSAIDTVTTREPAYFFSKGCTAAPSGCGETSRGLAS
jgi:hypothetical protein